MTEKNRKQKSNPKKKPRFVVDADSEVVFRDRNFCEIKKYGSFISVADLTGDAESSDADIISCANREKVHIITGNYKDFKEFPKKNRNNIGVVSYKRPLVENKKRWDNLKNLIKGKSHQDFFGKCYYVSEDEIKEK